MPIPSSPKSLLSQVSRTFSATRFNHIMARRHPGPKRPEGPERRSRRAIAEETLDAIEKGFYLNYDIRDDIVASKRTTSFHPPDSELSSWASSVPPTPPKTTVVTIAPMSTLQGAKSLSDLVANLPTHAHSRDDEMDPGGGGGITRAGRSQVPTPPHPRTVGILNFASAMKPGGGFRSGAQAQEESIARSSTLYPTLMTSTGQRFYTLHNREPKAGYYSHALIYSPNVVIIKDDSGQWVEPFKADILTSAAVNAGRVRGSLWGRTAGPAEETRIESAMRERMARILYLFETKGIRDIVLGSFGTGVFRNDVDTVASIWADLLLKSGARFAGSFDNVMFAIIGGGDTLARFQRVFASYDVHR